MLYDLSKVPADTVALINSDPRYMALFCAKPDALLSISADAKTSKGEKLGYTTAILYLSPAKSSGSNMCAMAEAAGCVDACLFSAGRGAFVMVFLARLRKTLFFLQYRDEFMALLAEEIRRAERAAAKLGNLLLVRLNGTSDVRWERIKANGHASIMAQFSAVQFYDYTKLANRDVPANYDLTFSYSAVDSYAENVAKAKARGMRMAVVFRSRAMVDAMLANGDAFQGMRVVDGDDTDVRHLDPQGAAVALYAKGRAKQDRSGFVIG